MKRLLGGIIEAGAYCGHLGLTDIRLDVIRLVVIEYNGLIIVLWVTVHDRRSLEIYGNVSTLLGVSTVGLVFVLERSWSSIRVVGTYFSVVYSSSRLVYKRLGRRAGFL